MEEYDDNTNDLDSTDEFDNKLEGATLPDDFNAQFADELDATDMLEEDSESTDDSNEVLLEQQGYDEAYAEDTEQAEKEEAKYENLSDEELREKYEGVRAHDAALGDQYVKYDEQIGQISRDKAYYSSKEWNVYMDEKIKAQNVVSTRRYQIQSEMRALEKELNKRKSDNNGIIS